MNNYIKSLSKKDKKTLSQKALKLTEEVGELARVVLPYDSAHGTNHRFVDREALLEEIADVYLTNISIAYSLDFTDDEINDMIIEKAKKWDRLQIGEERGSFPLPYEIHVTVDAEKIEGRMNEIEDFNLENYLSLCKGIGVKPIVLDLEINNGGVIKDVMTSSKHIGDNRTAYEEMKRISGMLRQYGYIVLREKIETVPWHPAAPKLETGEKIPNHCYFEAHIGVRITPDRKEGLEDFVEGLDNGNTWWGPIELGGRCKLSQNFFKKSKNGEEFVNMITYRDDMTYTEQFEEDIESIKSALKGNEFDQIRSRGDLFPFEKVEVEYSIYDTKVSHDSKWING